MQPFFGPRFGNPSSMHRWGREARTALDEARERVGRCLGASAGRDLLHLGRHRGGQPGASSAPGARGAARRPQRRRVARRSSTRPCSAPCTRSPAEGGEERLLAVDSRRASSTPRRSTRSCATTSRSCSVMWVNNEIGTVQDVPALAERREGARRRVPHRRGAGVRQGGDRRAHARRSTYLSISGHKIGAPKGIGALFIRRGTPIEPLMLRRHRRTAAGGPGTENVAMAVGFARAAELAVAEREEECARLERAARPRSRRRCSRAIPDAVIHGRGAPRAPHILEHLGPGHGQRVDAHGARSARRRLLRRLGVPERKHRRRRTCSTAIGVPHGLAVGGDPLQPRRAQHRGARRSRGRGVPGAHRRRRAGCRRRPAERADAASACWSRCLAAWTRPSPRRCSSSRATTSSARR